MIYFISKKLHFSLKNIMKFNLIKQTMIESNTRLFLPHRENKTSLKHDVLHCTVLINSNC